MQNSTIDGQASLSQRCNVIAQLFAAQPSVLDVARGEMMIDGDLPLRGNFDLWCELSRRVLTGGKTEFIADHSPLALLAIPLSSGEDDNCVALLPLLLHAAADDAVIAAAKQLTSDETVAQTWARTQQPRVANQQLALANLLLDRWRSETKFTAMQREIDDLSAHLSATYEEISLLHRLTQNLKVSGSNEQLGRLALQWLAEALPVQGLALQLLPKNKSGEKSENDTPNETASRRDLPFLRYGRCPLDEAAFAELLVQTGATSQRRAIVLNPLARGDANWPFPAARQLILVPLTEGDNLFGWLAAINHRDDLELGTSEASLLASVAAILGIHAGNIELYREQAEFLAGVVRALTSAIDAKDPYTCGHSDRVARVAVRLAEELGYSESQRETLYLSGLLHDIGKIGIDDQVLRKPGKLTEEEFAHIQQHPEIGYRILKDIQQLGEVLPVVRHHHEAWDGTGYPFGLAGQEIPEFARIVAVADSFDAMSSDRPYRRGMPDEKLDAIFRGGAGTQWDARVVEAFFQAREDIRRLTKPDEAKSQELVPALT